MGKGQDELVALLSWQFLARPNGVQVVLERHAEFGSGSVWIRDSQTRRCR